MNGTRECGSKRPENNGIGKKKTICHIAGAVLHELRNISGSKYIRRVTIAKIPG